MSSGSSQLSCEEIAFLNDIESRNTRDSLAKLVKSYAKVFSPKNSFLKSRVREEHENCSSLIAFERVHDATKVHCWACESSWYDNKSYFSPTSLDKKFTQFFFVCSSSLNGYPKNALFSHHHHHDWFFHI